MELNVSELTVHFLWLQMWQWRIIKHWPLTVGEKKSLKLNEMPITWTRLCCKVLFHFRWSCTLTPPEVWSSLRCWKMICGVVLVKVCSWKPLLSFLALHLAPKMSATHVLYCISYYYTLMEEHKFRCGKIWLPLHCDSLHDISFACFRSSLSTIWSI